MPVAESNQQIAIVLSKEEVAQLDEFANEEMRTRSKAAAKIIIDFLRKREAGKS